MATRGPLCIFVLALVACGDGKSNDPVAEDDLVPAIADVVCDLQAHCGCDMPLTEEQCHAAIAAAFMMFLEPPPEAGLVYDAQCGGEAVGLYEELGCQTIDEFLDENRCRPCKLYYGSKHAGDPCMMIQDIYDDCGQGLLCSGTACVDPCARAGEGEACLGRQCADGLVCSVSQDAMGELVSECKRAAKVGESCAELPCAEELQCDFETMTCEQPPGAGEQCNGFCHDGTWCDTSDADPMAWVCRATKADGEACTSGSECTSHMCDATTMTCAPLEPFVCQVAG